MSDTIHRLPRVERFGDRSIDSARYVSEDHLEAEIQALSSFGFQYLSQHYLPRKLKEADWI